MNEPVDPSPRLFITLYLQVSLPLRDIQKLLAELLCHCIDLCHILIAEGGHDLYIVLKPCDIFTLLEHSFHDFSCSRCPASQ